MADRLSQLQDAVNQVQYSFIGETRNQEVSNKIPNFCFLTCDF